MCGDTKAGPFLETWEHSDFVSKTFIALLTSLEFHCNVKFSLWRTVKAGVIQLEPAGVEQDIDNHKLQLNATVTIAEDICVS